MRISDWSSDVCSSDLYLSHMIQSFPNSNRHHRRRQSYRPAAIDSTCYPKLAPARWSGESLSCQQDRKSVVEGKGVSVRVDLGGSRRIKKKKMDKKTEITVQDDTNSKRKHKVRK